MPESGRYVELLNSDAEIYGGSNRRQRRRYSVRGHRCTWSSAQAYAVPPTAGLFDVEACSEKRGRESLPFSRSVVLACITTATFADLVAYSVSVPILPDFATRFNASPTMVGLLFASFGITLLILSIPMGAISDRIGRKGPMIAGLALLAISTLAFAYAQSLSDAVRCEARPGRGGRNHLDRRLRDDCRSLRAGRARPRDGPRDGRQHTRHHHRPRDRRMVVRSRRHSSSVSWSSRHWRSSI